MTYATLPDVETRLGRPLSESEQAQVTALLGDVEALIKSRIPDLDDQVTAGTIDETLVVMVEVAAVLRVIRNPSGFRQESDGDYAYTVDSRAAGGYLTLLDFEWLLLGVTAGAFTITPAIDTCPPVPVSDGTWIPDGVWRAS